MGDGGWASRTNDIARFDQSIPVLMWLGRIIPAVLARSDCSGGGELVVLLTASEDKLDWTRAADVPSISTSNINNCE